LFGSGIEVVELDYHQAATFDAAVEWSDRIFLQPAPFDDDAHETLAPLLDWAVQAGIDHVVAMSAMGMDIRDDLPLARLERHVQSLGVAYTLLRPNVFMQNFSSGFLGDRIRRRGSFSMPVGDSCVSLVDGRDVAAVAAAALTSHEHDEKVYTLTGPQALTHAEIADVISSVSGRKVEFETCSDEDMLGWLTGSGWRSEVAGAVIALYQSIRDGVRATVTSDVQEVLGRPPITFRHFAAEHVAHWS
jgi:uncharacterized protein YbjT (DUF2867 family)